MRFYKRVGNIVKLFLIVSFSMGCDSNSDDESTTSTYHLSIRGRITSSVDGTPIQGARVIVSLLTLFNSAESGVDGHYQLAFLAENCADPKLETEVGGLHMNIEKEGYKFVNLVQAGHSFLGPGDTDGDNGLAITTHNGGAIPRCTNAVQTINIALEPR